MYFKGKYSATNYLFFSVLTLHWMELSFLNITQLKSALINNYLLLFIGILLCLIAFSIPIDAAKKKLLKKLAKELGYKLEEAIEQVLKFII